VLSALACAVVLPVVLYRSCRKKTAAKLDIEKLKLKENEESPESREHKKKPSKVPSTTPKGPENGSASLVKESPTPGAPNTVGSSGYPNGTARELSKVEGSMSEVPTSTKGPLDGIKESPKMVLSYKKGTEVVDGLQRLAAADNHRDKNKSNRIDATTQSTGGGGGFKPVRPAPPRPKASKK
jgi:hypothetical protein